jgi:hypothetical protein
MMRLSWKRGSVDYKQGAFMLSATRFTYRNLTDMPGVFWHGLGLRRNWAQIEGAIGVFIGADLLQRTTYTVSAWSDEADLRRWLASPEHARLMRGYGPRLQSSAAVSWTADRLALREIFAAGMARLAAKDRATR